MEISNALNAGTLPPDFFALAEQFLSGPIPDVVTLQRNPFPRKGRDDSGGLALADAPPRAAYMTSAEIDPYVRKANQIVIKHRHGDVVAVIEIVSPGNKSSVHAIATFVNKTAALLRRGINLLVVDLLPPSPRDPSGIHKAIWDEISEEPYLPPPDKPLTAAAYSAAEPMTAYVEPLAVGDRLPSLPIFLQPDRYVPAPLEATYQLNWSKCPGIVRELVEG